MEILNSIKAIFCGHEHQMFIRNVYDNEFWLGRVFQCMKCDTMIYKDVGGNIMKMPLKQSAHLLQIKSK